MLKDFKICDEVTPTNVAGGAETELMKALEETSFTYG